jgi:hypothetical protein
MNYRGLKFTNCRACLASYLELQGISPRAQARWEVEQELRHRQPPSKGPPMISNKKKSVTPVVGGWVRGQKRTRVRFIFPIFFLIVFLNSPHRETPKNVIKKNLEKVGFGLLVNFFVKLFDTIFVCKTFFVVFLNSHR